MREMLFVFLGPSGIGKTTILRTIAGLEKLKMVQFNLKTKFYHQKRLM
jgi:iron(III) transport system ATP-binding protein